MVALLREGEPKGARRLMFVLFILEWGLPFSEHTSLEFCVRGALSYEAGMHLLN